MMFKGATICSVVLLCYVALCTSQQDCCEDYCYSLDSERPQSQRFASKSVYQIVRGVDMSRHSVIPNCEPVKFWMMGRHGARLPSAKDMKKLKTLIDLRDQIIENYELRRTKPDTGHLCEPDYNIIKNWRYDSNITGDYDEFLTVQGWNDQKFLAKQYQRILPNVLETIYSADKFLFRHTPTQRTEGSFKAFAEGLFGENAYSHIRAETPANGSLLKPQSECSTYKENKRDNESPTSEWNKFVASPVFQDMLKEVSMRLGFKLVLPAAQVELIWDMCRFEQSWYIERLSPWCAAFTKSHVAVLEYKEDLFYYYKAGYGNPVNEQIACSSMTDMLKHLQSRSGGPKVVASFAHSTNIQLMIAAMGVFRDREPLRADNFSQMKRRQFRISRIDPFSANLVAIAYDCTNEPEKQKVMFFLNERPLELDWCRVGLCDWTRVEEKYQKYLSGIDCAREFCTESGSSVKISGSAMVLIGLLGVVFLEMQL